MSPPPAMHGSLRLWHDPRGMTSGDPSRTELGNRNVRVFFLFNFAQSLGRGIWMGNILSLYIVLLAEGTVGGILGLTPNELLGVTSAITGVAMLLAVLPAGFLADLWSPRGTIAIGSVAGSVGLGFLAFGTGLPSIAIGLFFWGVFIGFTRPAAEAMLANSTRSGDRSLIYSRAHLLEQIGSGSGPFLNVVLFLVLGDVWDLEILRSVMNVGLAVSLAAVISVLWMDEDHTLGEESEAIGHGDAAPAPGTRLGRRDRMRRLIPIAFLTSGFIIGSGAGMTVKFFPVFFRSIYGFQPIAVQLVMGASMLATALATWGAQKLSRRQGRGEMIVLLQAIAIACLFGMASYPPATLVILLFVTRGALMNATTPLSRTIVMDYVPRKWRGIVSSLQSVAWGLFWNASALIGGFLVGDNNFRRVFLVTAGVYVAGTALIIPFVRVVHREGGQMAGELPADTAMTGSPGIVVPGGAGQARSTLDP